MEQIILAIAVWVCLNLLALAAFAFVLRAEHRRGLPLSSSRRRAHPGPPAAPGRYGRGSAAA